MVYHADWLFFLCQMILKPDELKPLWSLAEVSHDVFSSVFTMNLKSYHTLRSLNQSSIWNRSDKGKEATCHTRVERCCLRGVHTDFYPFWNRIIGAQGPFSFFKGSGVKYHLQLKFHSSFYPSYSCKRAFSRCLKQIERTCVKIKGLHLSRDISP